MTGPAGPTGPLGATGPGVAQSPWTSLITAANHALVDAKTITFHAEFQNGNSGATGVIDWTAAQKQAITLSSVTVAFVFNPAPLGVGNFLLRSVVGPSGPYAWIWPTGAFGVKWNARTPPAPSATAAFEDILSFYWNTTNYYGSYGNNFG